ncbi:EAL domain-containing protein [Leptothoe kymatousa]|uniref:EAL domain-containing protein n=1 Tax=Leptothoe kymatousa TAU-MAC 1615 TaxID=2364775 RepID=A0ABS5Y927_9CYAN|nr:EAL domain-containing protein [Leptothoe kymatousa]MBT9313450.1 EAL domain-containing protein [Leptothoe kymatousa TAU-MAC 1615]
MNQSLNSYDTPEKAILPAPPAVSSNATLATVIELMNNYRMCEISGYGQQNTSKNDWQHLRRNPGCVLITEQEKLQGILTERDIVRLTMNETDLEATSVAAVMNTPVFSLMREEVTDLVVVYNLMRRHRVRHLPIIDAEHHVQGLITVSSLRRTINTSYFLRFRLVREVMNPQVVTVLPTDSVRAAVQRLTAYNISCVVVVQPHSVNLDNSEDWGFQFSRSEQIPIGIVTERDILQFKALGLDLTTVTVADVMSSPLACVRPEDTLDMTQELMQKKWIRRLVVTTPQGFLAGIVTETNLTQVLDPVELYGVLEILQLQVCNLSESRDRLLKAQNFDLVMAFDYQEFGLVYQPQLELNSNKITGAEALIRWNSTTLGNVSPVDFIPWAEQTGFILKLGYWILETACKQAVRWQQMSAWEDVSIAVNISTKQLMDHHFISRTMEILQATGLPAHCLKLELTESVLVENVSLIAEKLKRLQELGLQIAIDDFGTGYASLSYLQHFHFDILKFDRLFIMEIDQNPKKQAIVSSILRMAKQLHFKVVAEGVETQAEKDFLTVQECHYMQGFLLSRPLTVQDWSDFMENHYRS